MTDIHTPTPEPRWVEFANVDDFNAAVDAIEAWDKSREKVVVRVGDAPEPDLTKPYTDYDRENLLIWADVYVIELLNIE